MNLSIWSLSLKIKVGDIIAFFYSKIGISWLSYGGVSGLKINSSDSYHS